MIVPVALNQNKSPVIHVSHNVCLESWCVKYVYSYAYQKLLEYRKLVSRMKLISEDSKIIKRLLLGALLINPEVLTFWNMRRELLTEHFLNINTEFKISKLILTYKSKSMETFSYRKWLLTRALNEIHDKNWIDKILNDELLVCDMTAQKNQNNYHSWGHRIWCIENLAPNSTNLSLVLQHELNYSENWIALHVSEHTGFHYRQFIINKIRNIEFFLETKYMDCINKHFENITKRENTTNILIYIFGTTDQMWNEINVSLMFNSVALFLYELTLIEELNNVYVDHESIWYHRRYVLYNLFSLISSYYGIHSTSPNAFVPYYDTDSNIVSSLVNPFLSNAIGKLDPRGEKCPKINCDLNYIIQSSNLYKYLLKSEKYLINKFMINKKCNLINDDKRNLDLAKKHEKWLRFILGVNEI